MERQKCKLCFRVFPNGRSLGGHMKSHLAKLRIPPKSSSPTTRRPRRGGYDPATESSSSIFYSEEEDQLEVEQIVKSRAVAEAGGFGGGGDIVYGLRENPRKSFRVSDLEFSFAGSSSVVQDMDRDSETESGNPTRRRSKRTRKSEGVAGNQRWILEQEPVSWVSDTSPEEDVAMCLVMLSRDVNWKRRCSYESDEIEEEKTENGGEIKKRREASFMAERSSRICRKKLKCEKCMKQFQSSQALGSHRLICSLNRTQLGGGGMGNVVVVVADRIFRCPYCPKLFGSGQALGGHKRSHLTGGRSYPSPAAATPPPAAAKIDKNYSFLDLNLAAPVKDDDFSASVVSDA